MRGNLDAILGARGRWGLFAGVLLLSAGLSFWALMKTPARVFSQPVILVNQVAIAGQEVRVPVRVRWSGPGTLVVEKVESS